MVARCSGNGLAGPGVGDVPIARPRERIEMPGLTPAPLSKSHPSRTAGVRRPGSVVVLVVVGSTNSVRLRLPLLLSPSPLLRPNPDGGKQKPNHLPQLPRNRIN